MEEFNDKSQTMKFTPPHEEKQHIERTEDNIYSHARKNNEYYPPEQESGSSRTLVYVALILAILLIIAVTVGLIVLNMDNFKNNQTTPPDDEIVTQNDDNEENEEEDEKEEKDPVEEIQINYYNIVFYSDSIIENDNGYSILADLFDESMSKLDNRKLFINDKTDIRESGKRLSPEGLVYIVENTAGESIVFEAQIRENDDVVISISFDGSFEEETSPEEAPAENEGEEENPPTDEEPDDEITIPEESEEGAGVIVE